MVSVPLDSEGLLLCSTFYLVSALLCGVEVKNMDNFLPLKGNTDNPIRWNLSDECRLRVYYGVPNLALISQGVGLLLMVSSLKFAVELCIVAISYWVYHVTSYGIWKLKLLHLANFNCLSSWGILSFHRNLWKRWLFVSTFVSDIIAL